MGLVCFTLTQDQVGGTRGDEQLILTDEPVKMVTDFVDACDREIRSKNSPRERKKLACKAILAKTNLDSDLREEACLDIIAN